MKCRQSFHHVEEIDILDATLLQNRFRKNRENARRELTELFKRISHSDIFRITPATSESSTIIICPRIWTRTISPVWPDCLHRLILLDCYSKDFRHFSIPNMHCIACSLSPSDGVLPVLDLLVLYHQPAHLSLLKSPWKLPVPVVRNQARTGEPCTAALCN